MRSVLFPGILVCAIAGLGCGEDQICPDGVLESNVEVLSGGIWVARAIVPPWMVDDGDGLSNAIVRIGSVASSPLEACSSVNGNIILGGPMPGIGSNAAQTMPAFSNLRSVTGSIVWVQQHPTDVIDAFNALEVLEGGVVTEIGLVSEMRGFNSLVVAGSIDGTRTSTGYNSLEEVKGSISIPNDASGLAALKSVGGDLYMYGPANPASLLSLESVGGSLLIESVVPAVSELVVPRLTRVGHDVHIVATGFGGDDCLEGLALEEVGGAVTVRRNTGIESGYALSWAGEIPVIRGESEAANEVGAIYVCDNFGDEGNCEGEANYAE